MSEVIDRFLRYVAFDTQSSEVSQESPSTAKQHELAKELAEELRKMGASIDVKEDQSSCKVHGVPTATGADMDIPDLRAGAALTIAALAAEGKSVLSGIDYIERGYEDFDLKLRELGADIVKVPGC